MEPTVPDPAASPQVRREAFVGGLAVTRRHAILRALQFVGYAVSMVALGAAVVANVRAYVHPAPTPFEFVDVVVVNGPSFVPRATTVDVTGDSVTRIAPYDSHLAEHPSRRRAFEALGKYLAMGTFDPSRPDALTRFQATMRPLGIESRGDVVVFDVDPRQRDVTVDQVAAAIVDGEYWSRTDVVARLKK